MSLLQRAVRQAPEDTVIDCDDMVAECWVHLVEMMMKPTGKPINDVKDV